jgi:hypothetical protein
MSSEDLNLHQMNTDILSKIFEEVTIQNKDEVAVFREKYNQYILEKEYTDKDFSDACEFDVDCDEVENWIDNYVTSLKQTQKNSILCNYGISNALMLLRDFHIIGMGDNADDICEDIEMKIAEGNMVELILKDAVGFNSKWRQNADY